MVCCQHCCAAAEAHFGRKAAERDLQRYKRRGADATTRLMLAELRRRPLRGCDLLDVGAGIGIISAELAECGVANVTAVEASPAYLDVARKELAPRYAPGSTQFVLGDFALIAPTLSDADVVTLGRVVCCYANGEALLQAAASRARQLLALTYPRYRWYMRTVTAIQNFWRRARGDRFQTYVHAPKQMEEVLNNAGLVRVVRRGTPVWVLDVYARSSQS